MKKLLFILPFFLIQCNRVEQGEEIGASYFPASLLSETQLNDTWYQVAKNPQANSLSLGSIYRLNEAWTYVPPLPTNGTTRYVSPGYIMADGNYIWFKHEVYDPAVSGSHDYSVIDKIDFNGNKIWQSKKVGLNHSLQSWPAKTGDRITINDDCVHQVYDATGNNTGSGLCLDIWGRILLHPNGINYFTCNYQHIDGGGLWLGKMTNSFTMQWQKYFPGSVPGYGDVTRGSMCYDNNKLFVAPAYRNSSTGAWFPEKSGVIAMNDNGDTLWKKLGITPTGKISAGNNSLFLFEWYYNLICIDQDNGNIKWSIPVPKMAIGQPPIVTEDKVIIATELGIYAYDFDGFLRWHNPIPNILLYLQQHYETGTVMAAASGSKTLIVTSVDGVYLLDYNTGQQVDFIHPSSIGFDFRPCNPIIIGNRCYVNVASKTYKEYQTSAVIALQDGDFSPPPPPPADTTAPTVPQNVTISNITTSSLTLSWNPSTDDKAVTGYKINWRAQGGSWLNQTTTNTSYFFSNLSANTTYEFNVQAYDAVPNYSAQSNTVIATTLTPPPPPPPPAPDTEPPVVNIISPEDNSTLPSEKNENVIISVSASDNVGVTQVGIFIDGAFVSSGYNFKWNTKKTPPGNHIIKATARDAAGNQSSNQITVYKN